MAKMEAKYVVVFGGGHPELGPEEIFNIAAGMCVSGNDGMERYFEKKLIPLMREDPGKRAFIVKDASSGWGKGFLYIVTEDDGYFWKEVLGEGKEKTGEPYPFEVRELELGDDEVLRCTGPYTKEFDGLVKAWEKRGIAALDCSEKA
jgi:hypothetical protein